MSTLYSIGLMNQLGDAMEAARFTTDDVPKLRCSPQLGMFRSVVRGQAEISVTKHIINLDADPFVLEGWKVEEHWKDELFEWNPGQVTFYFSPGQEGDRTINGHKLHKELKGKSVFNANLLDYLLVNRQLIPEEWKGMYVFFWGTIYSNSVGRLYVRSCLCIVS